jgi:hypothetical protein
MWLQVLPHLSNDAGSTVSAMRSRRGQREVVAAAAADPVLLLELLAEQHAAAGLALDPESTGHVLLLAEAGPSHSFVLGYSGLLTAHMRRQQDTGPTTGRSIFEPRCFPRDVLCGCIGCIGGVARKAAMASGATRLHALQSGAARTADRHCFARRIR